MGGGGAIKKAKSERSTFRFLNMPKSFAEV